MSGAVAERRKAMHAHSPHCVPSDPTVAQVAVLQMQEGPRHRGSLLPPPLEPLQLDVPAHEADCQPAVHHEAQPLAQLLHEDSMRLGRCTPRAPRS